MIKALSVIGLGYVGLPLACALSKKHFVIGFDINATKIEKYKQGVDLTGEVGNDKLANCGIDFTSESNRLKEANFHIIAVPTPVGKNNLPNLDPVISSSKILGSKLQKGSIVVYESTVYPGVTEEICVPILEKESRLKCGIDFKVGYSPERINPGDKVHTVDKIVKVVSGMDQDSLEQIAEVYESAIEAGVYRASSIKVAEAAKVIENSQRDINIAFVNELSIIFHKMEIDTLEVLKAASTKWNFLQFYPGLVGGHCIGVDPYYLTYRAQELGYQPEVILAGRRINDNMGKYVAENTIKMMIKADRPIKHSKVLVMGLTFKENISDIRNSKVVDTIKELQEYGVEVFIDDPRADCMEVKDEYGLELCCEKNVSNVDAIILAVPHEDYLSLKLDDLKNKYSNAHPVLMDIKGVFDRIEAENLGYLYWRL
jgi:UDP-N-acetyl-D-galactosamine dehydrogenase